jgi:hypothetical protein
MGSPGTGTTKDNAGRFVSVQHLPYRSPVLIEYGSVSKLTEGSISKAGDGASGMMMSPCL